MLDASAERHGGWAALTSPQPSWRHARVVFEGDGSAARSATVTTWYALPDRLRLEIQVAEEPLLVQVADGARLAEWLGPNLTDRPLREEVERRLFYADLWRRFREAVELEGRIVVDGGERYAVLELRTPGAAWQMWVDAEDSSLRRVMQRTRGGDGPVERTDLLFDLRAVADGRVLPHRRVSVQDGRKVAESWLEDFRLLSTLDGNLFRSRSAEPD